MGMGPQFGPMIPSGMVITKPSQAKAQEKLALEKLEEEKKNSSIFLQENTPETE